MVVPRGTLALLALGLALQIGAKIISPPPRANAEDLPPAPSMAALRLASFGDPVALAKALMLYLQAFDYQSGSTVPYRDPRLRPARDLAHEDSRARPRRANTLFSPQAGCMRKVPVEAKQRRMLEFVYRQFLLDPNRSLALARSCHGHRQAQAQGSAACPPLRSGHPAVRRGRQRSPLGEADGDLYSGGHERAGNRPDDRWRLYPERVCERPGRTKIPGRTSQAA